MLEDGVASRQRKAQLLVLEFECSDGWEALVGHADLQGSGQVQVGFGSPCISARRVSGRSHIQEDGALAELVERIRLPLVHFQSQRRNSFPEVAGCADVITRMYIRLPGG